jgi:hypothetical protein
VKVEKIARRMVLGMALLKAIIKIDACYHKSQMNYEQEAHA